MNRPKTHTLSLLSGLAIAAAAICMSPSARANIYASNIKLNGTLTNASVNRGTGVTISYVLNEPATLGATVNIMSGSNVVRTYNFASGNSGALRGSNSFVWDGKDTGGNTVGVGTYSLSITAATSGFTNWTKTSIDSNPGMPAYFSKGIAVDNNTNSPYYGRVIVGCCLHNTGGTSTVPVAARKDGLYKVNADGSQADEGWYGNANYLTDDGGDGQNAGEMASSGGFNPMKIRIGEDDRIYWVDNSLLGRIIACDMQATTNQIVLDEPGWANMGDIGDTGDHVGFQVFDVSQTTTTNAAIWLADNDFPNWGVWMFHMTNGVSDPNDTVGAQAVETGGDLQLVSSGGVMVDYNLDIFIGQSRSSDTGANADYYALEFTNWNGGVLAPEGANFANAIGANPGEAAWGYGTNVNQVGLGDPTFEAVQDVVIDSRVHPTMVACPLGKGGNNNGGGIRVLNATNGSLISYTNGTYIQTLTNIDWGQQYLAAAWDNVGNLYGVSSTLNLWREWSPPGANQATTVAVETINIIASLTISSIHVTGGTVTINFSDSSSDTAASFTLLGSATVNPASAYLPVSGTVITQLSPGNFQATASTSGSIGFYRIKHN